MVMIEPRHPNARREFAASRRSNSGRRREEVQARSGGAGADEMPTSLKTAAESNPDALVDECRPGNSPITAADHVSNRAPGHRGGRWTIPRRSGHIPLLHVILSIRSRTSDRGRS